MKWQQYHWHFEVSAKCTLKCPRCPRNDSAPVPWLNKELDLGFFQRLLTPQKLREQVRRITMCGDIGDPIYASQYLDIIRYIKSTNPKIHVYTITNGSYRKPQWWNELAEISNEYDTINFSVDGYDHDSNNLYRVNSDWESIMTGMNVMCNRSAAFVYWATIIFKFNQDHIDTMKSMARQHGCDGFQITHSTKFGSRYGDAYGGINDPFEPDSKYISATNRYERYFFNLSGRTPPNQEYLQENLLKFHQIKRKHNIMITPMCLIGNRGLYVSADGVLHPCSWVSFPYVSMSTTRKTIMFKNSFHQRYRDLLNLHNRNLDDILNDSIWQKLSDSFDTREKTWVECEQKCHKNLVDENYAVGWFTN